MKILKKTMTVIADVVPELRTPKDMVREMSTESLVSGDPSTSEIVNEHKPYWNMKGSTFTIFNDHCEGN